MLNIDGSVVVVSLATGLIVLSANGVSTAAGIDVEEYYGCQLSEAQAKLSSDCSGFRLVATDSYIGLLVTDKVGGANSLSCFHTVRIVYKDSDR